ncbi:chondroitinase-B domain-containing protein [Mariniflexile sp. AS56]|uniref:chondroitinase-B domain-containing protein n=1 Tax=Mariniflexile sp. AS56 TaxID=3063957 RepID=UPI0026F00F2D|nr:chondroitinase-B domain-containing protein [Mariniflexile sp. AS56]MDO7173274.1 chondroitinase-B domain-containing protein [Mariniflexile sp. AS56]
MKRIFSISSLLIFLVTCQLVAQTNSIKVSNINELNEAIKKSKAGDHIVMANGVWKDVEIKFSGKGTKEKPITLTAEEIGKVTIEGTSNLKIGGSYLIVNGLYFKNGHTPSKNVIQFKIDSQLIANNCTVTQCVIEEFTQPDRDVSDHWVEFWGRHNELSHCYITGKSNFGPTIMIRLEGNENIYNYHKIINNHFGPRPRKGGPHGETIQLGDSGTSMTPSHTLVANNFFDRCNGEIEIISSKSNFNEFRNNVFFESEGSLVLRHGNYATIDGNVFIGNDNSENIGGIRVINTGHWITNNYFYKIKGNAFRSALAVMNGIPKSPLNRYNQVTDAVIAYNSFIDCESPWQFSVGSNVSQSDVLPATEIRSARPERVILANNLIYNEVADENPIVNYDKVDGVTFKNNIITNENKSEIKPEGLATKPVSMSGKGNDLFVPNENINDVYAGFDFETITSDLFGNSRTSNNNSIGAIVNPIKDNAVLIDRTKFGTNWFVSSEGKIKSKTINVATSEELVNALKKANSNDIISLKNGVYQIKSSLVINKKISIVSAKRNRKPELIFSSDKTAFEMHPKGHLSLKGVILTGNKSQNTFTTLDKNMSKAYNLFIDGVEIKNFKSVLEVSKGSFADTVSVANSIIKNCERGFILNKETNDGGDYNAEFVIITNSTFDNIQEVVLDYYRGGYDESTIGGNLTLKNNTFTNSAKAEKDSILIKNRGIVNVEFSKNTFKNNPVKIIAILWGEKGQEPGENTIVNSGKIEVVQNLELKLMY